VLPVNVRAFHLVQRVTMALSFCGSVAALGLAGWQTVVELRWLGMDPGSPWVRPTGGFGVAIISGLLALGLVAIGAASLRLRELERQAGPPPPRIGVSTARRRRLMNALQYLPAALPAGWSEPMSVKGTVAWTFAVKDAIATVWTVAGDVGPSLHVALARKGGEGRVSDVEALEVFGAFVDVTEFVEVESAPSRVLQTHPLARAWMALPREVAAALPRPERLPVPDEKPLNQHLIAARKHLPEKLPFGWSVPVAVTDKYEGWDDGAWMVEDDDAVVIACLVTSRGRVKLAVTIFHPDQSDVTEARAMAVLKHFRGISEFVQTDATGVQGGRMYLGEIQKTDSRALLN
jgi:hypothetical protein